MENKISDGQMLVIKPGQVNAINPQDARIMKTNGQLQPVDGGWKILKQAMITHLPKRDVFDVVKMSIAKACADLNVKDTSQQDRDYLVNEATDNIIKYYPSIRLSEIPDAIALGVRGRYGEFYGLSVITFERFIEQYLLSEKRTAMVKELPPDESTPQPPDLTTQFETAKYLVMQALQRKQDNRNIEVTASSAYGFLDELGLIHFTIDEKYNMMADAVRELIEELKFKLTLARQNERMEIKADLEVYKKAIIEHAPLYGRRAGLVKLRAKKLALDAYLNNVMMEEINLVQLVESKRGLFLERG
ncbi:MAG: hypothetical protein JWP44_2850 [Mucilaginibacter sp.]|nr:hypothetical protein [Mucilaginibacter sp.]